MKALDENTILLHDVGIGGECPGGCNRRPFELPDGCSADAPEIPGIDVCSMDEPIPTVFDRHPIPLIPPDADFNTDTYCVDVETSVKEGKEEGVYSLKWATAAVDGIQDCAIGQYRLELTYPPPIPPHIPCNPSVRIKTDSSCTLAVSRKFEDSNDSYDESKCGTLVYKLGVRVPEYHFSGCNVSTDESVDEKTGCITGYNVSITPELNIIGDGCTTSVTNADPSDAGYSDKFCRTLKISAAMPTVSVTGDCVTEELEYDSNGCLTGYSFNVDPVNVDIEAVPEQCSTCARNGKAYDCVTYDEIHAVAYVNSQKIPNPYQGIYINPNTVNVQYKYPGGVIDTTIPSSKEIPLSEVIESISVRAAYVGVEIPIPITGPWAYWQKYEVKNTYTLCEEGDCLCKCACEDDSCDSAEYDCPCGGGLELRECYICDEWGPGKNGCLRKHKEDFVCSSNSGNGNDIYFERADASSCDVTYRMHNGVVVPYMSVIAKTCNVNATSSVTNKTEDGRPTEITMSISVDAMDIDVSNSDGFPPGYEWECFKEGGKAGRDYACNCFEDKTWLYESDDEKLPARIDINGEHYVAKSYASVSGTAKVSASCDSDDTPGESDPDMEVGSILATLLDSVGKVSHKTVPLLAKYCTWSESENPPPERWFACDDAPACQCLREPEDGLEPKFVPCQCNAPTIDDTPVYECLERDACGKCTERGNMISTGLPCAKVSGLNIIKGHCAGCDSPITDATITFKRPETIDIVPGCGIKVDKEVVKYRSDGSPMEVRNVISSEPDIRFVVDNQHDEYYGVSIHKRDRSDDSGDSCEPTTYEVAPYWTMPDIQFVSDEKNMTTKGDIGTVEIKWDGGLDYDTWVGPTFKVKRARICVTNNVTTSPSSGTNLRLRLVSEGPNDPECLQLYGNIKPHPGGADSQVYYLLGKSKNLVWNSSNFEFELYGHKVTIAGGHITEIASEATMIGSIPTEAESL